MPVRQTYSQFFPPKPVFTEKECPDQTGKIFIITGGYAGVGLELTKILFQKNASIYIAGRSKSKAENAISGITTEYASSRGRLEFLYLDLNDLATVKAAVQEFLDKESRLHVLWNNAGVMVPPVGSKTQQGYEMQLGCNSLAHFLLAKLLLPTLSRTADTAPADSVRICWAASVAAETGAPDGIINFNDINHEKSGSQRTMYAQSKAANILLASEFARRYQKDKILNISFNPGNLKTELQRHSTFLRISAAPLVHPAIFGAYTELYTGISPEVTKELDGSYIIPWGRVGILTTKLQKAVKSEDQGGSGAASKYYDWCEHEVEKYL